MRTFFLLAFPTPPSRSGCMRELHIPLQQPGRAAEPGVWLLAMALGLLLHLTEDMNAAKKPKLLLRLENLPLERTG